MEMKTRLNVVERKKVKDNMHNNLIAQVCTSVN